MNYIKYFKTSWNIVKRKKNILVKVKNNIVNFENPTS